METVNKDLLGHALEKYAAAAKAYYAGKLSVEEGRELGYQAERLGATRAQLALARGGHTVSRWLGGNLYANEVIEGYQTNP